MAYDALLNLYGPATATATTQGSAKAWGRNRAMRVEARVGGDVTGTTPSMTITVEQSATGTGSWALIPGATFAAITDEQVGFVGGTTPRYEVPGEDPLSMTVTPTQDYVRAVLTLSGTTPSFPLTSVNAFPIDSPTKRSGVS